jgi:hypothetical protein
MVLWHIQILRCSSHDYGFLHPWFQSLLRVMYWQSVFVMAPSISCLAMMMCVLGSSRLDWQVSHLFHPEVIMIELTVMSSISFCPRVIQTGLTGRSTTSSVSQGHLSHIWPKCITWKLYISCLAATCLKSGPMSAQVSCISHAWRWAPVSNLPQSHHW